MAKHSTGFGQFGALESLVTTAMQPDRRGHRGVRGPVRLGMVFLSLVIALDVDSPGRCTACSSPVSKGISMLAAVLRLVYAGVFMVAVAQLVGVSALLTYLSSVHDGPAGCQVLMRIDAYTDIWTVGLLLFGLHLDRRLPGVSLGLRPQLLGVLLVIAGLGYAVDTFGAPEHVTTMSPRSHSSASSSWDCGS